LQKNKRGNIAVEFNFVQCKLKIVKKEKERRNEKKKRREEKRISKDMVDADLIVKLIKERTSKKGCIEEK
jgi:hypothetical protein